MVKWLLDNEGNKVDMESARAGALDEEYPRALIELCASRDWDGMPSVTQCLKGTREAFLRVVVPHAIVPSDMSFAILGTRAHRTMEEYAGMAAKLGTLAIKAEISLNDGDIKGTADCLEQHGDEWWLIDYKTWGSYRIMKALGMYQEEEAIVDDAGEPVRFKSGPRKGQAKTRKIPKIDPEMRDIRDADLQLNYYRMLAETGLDIAVSRMRVYAVVRDGGTGAAYSRGIMRKDYYLDIPRMDNEEVLKFFTPRANDLKKAIADYREHISGAELLPEERVEKVREIVPPVCPEYERWNGRKCCLEYCPIAIECRSLGDHPDGPLVLAE